MAKIQLEFPVLIRRYPNNHYLVKPLFFDFGQAFTIGFQKALDELRLNLLKDLRRRTMDKDRIDELLWMKFCPETSLGSLHLEFKSGKQFVNQPFTISWFILNNYLVLHLPDFNNHMLMFENPGLTDPLSDKDIIEKISDSIKALLRLERSKREEPPDIKKYASRKGEFISILRFKVFIANPIPEAFSPRKLFESLFGDKKFHGAIELYDVGQSLNELYPSSLQRAFLMNEQVEKVENLLFRREPVALAIVGKPGTGKTSILHEAVRSYISKQKDPFSKGTREVFLIDPNRIIAGMSVVGMWQKRLESIINYIIKPAKKRSSHILYVDNPVALFRIGKSASNDMTLSAVFKSYLEKQQLPFVIEATPEEWKIIQETDRRFADLFRVLRISEPGYEKAVEISVKQRAVLENRQPIRLENDALMKLFSLQRLYMHQNALPGSVAEYMKRLAVKYNTYVREEEISKDFSERSSLNPKLFDQKVISKDEVAHTIQKRLIGQKDAVIAMSEVVHVINAGLNDPSKPMASMLFIGPTGVGKTQAAKVLANYLFDSEDNMLRFDMNEYIDSDAVRRLIGDFYNPEGQLTGRVRYNPFCVLLLDEIEKAHPDVLDLLLQVLGEGRLTDSAGNTVDFSNTIIIMTSNLGAARAARELGYVKNQGSLTQTYKKAVEDFFRPELLNRIDEVIIFQRLAIDEIIQIAQIMITELLSREGFIRRTTILKIQADALRIISERGFDSSMGARSLKRNIEKEVTELAANYLIDVTPDTPVLFELFISKSKLVPRLTPFRNIEQDESLSLPVFDKKSTHEDRLKTLLEDLEEMEYEVITFREEKEAESDHAQPDHYTQTELYTLTDQIRFLKDELESNLLDLEMGRRQEGLSDVKFKVRGYGVNMARRSFLYIDHKFIQDVYKQLEIRDYLNEVYRSLSNMIGDEDSEIYDFLIQHTFLSYFWEGFRNNINDQVCIHIKPLMDQEENTFRIYDMPFLNLWKDWSFIRKIKGPKGFYEENEKVLNTENHIFLEGPMIYDLLKYEDGIHLFYHESRLFPVMVKVECLKSGQTFESFISDKERNLAKALKELEQGKISVEELPPINGRIVRLYVQDNMNPANDLITDLRTGTMIKESLLSERNTNLLMYHNIPDKYKLF